MKKNVKKEIYKVLGTIAAIVVLATVAPAMHSKCMTQAEYNRFNELVGQGYSDEVAWDQVQEEFHAMDGPFGTGGLDGQLLSSKPSGGGSGGGSGSGGSGGSGGGGQKPAHTHEYAEEITKEPTCTEDGLRTYKCKCGASYTEVIPAYDHDYQIDQSKHTDATCTAQATETFVCTDCGDSFVQPYGEFAPHDYQLAGDSKEPTCTEAGHYHWVCFVCGDEYYEDQEALDHDWSKEYTIEKSSSCTESGLKDIRCSRCGEVKPGSEVMIEAIGHLENPSHAITEATTFKDGKEVITCVTCGEIISEVVLPKKMNITAVIAACCVVMAVALLFIIISISKKKNKNATKGN
jgi:hypothetical protein